MEFKTKNDKKSKRILVVDDDEDVTYTIKKVLENNGFVVDSYNDPTLTLSNFKPGLYDLLLLDIKMPKINGFDLYQKIREIDSNVKICFLTASEFFYKEYRSLRTHPTVDKACFIQKPVSSEDLVRQLNEVLYFY
jgi:CheY-like chemotaxis protein